MIGRGFFFPHYMYNERACIKCGFLFLASNPKRIFCYPGGCRKLKTQLAEYRKPFYSYDPNRPLEGLDLVRERVRQRDNHRCQNCGKQWVPGTRRLDVHHLDEAMESVRSYQYDKDNLDKMITYCHKCHLNLDSVRRKIVQNR